MVQYSTYRKLEKELLTLARSCGFNGTPFLPEPPQTGTLEQEMESIWLSLGILPRPQTQRQRDLVRLWSRNIVLSSTSPANRKEGVVWT